MSLSSKSGRHGLSLIEILIALVMTLIVLGAMMFAFRYASTEIAQGRALMELSNQLRNAQNLVRTDADGVTVDVRPWSKSASPNGYFEMIEGSINDSTFAGSAEAVVGDVDDILALTVRSIDRSFRGRANGNVVESDVAEVVWWTSGGASFNSPITLHRRVLLIRPDVENIFPSVNLDNVSAAGVQRFFLSNDISARVQSAGNGNFTIVPNSLADLAKRENRFARTPGGNYPHNIQMGVAGAVSSADDLGLRSYELSRANLEPLGDPQLLAKAGEDIVLTDVIGFDLQVFSPDTPIEETGVAGNGIALEPDDPGYTGTGSVGAMGAFVDLGNGRSGGQFSALPNARFGLGAGQVVYDTFSTHYETDGPGSDGIDNDGSGGVDDNNERNVLPPYPYRLLGMKTTFRVVERNSKQVRQVEVVNSFVPQ